MFNPFRAIRTLQAQVSEQQTTITELKAEVTAYKNQVTALIAGDAVLAELRSINTHTHYVAENARKAAVRAGHERG